MPEPAPVRTCFTASSGEDDLAEHVALGHRGEPVARLVHRDRAVDQRPGAGRVEELHEGVELPAGAHRRADDRELLEEHVGQAGVVDVGTRRRTADDDAAARPQRADRVGPGRLADGLHHGVDLDRQPGAGLEDVVGAELAGPVALGLVAAGGEHGEAGGAAEGDQRGRDTAAGALHEHRLAGLAGALHEEHPVGRQPRGRQAGRLLEGQRRGLRHEVAARHDDLLGEGALVALGEQRATGVVGLVAGPVRVADRRRARRPRCRPRRGPRRRSPRIIGSASSRSPTPRSDQRSWWLRLAAFTVTVAHPSGASGAGRSPTTRPLSGSSKEKVSA